MYLNDKMEIVAITLLHFYYNKVIRMFYTTPQLIKGLLAKQRHSRHNIKENTHKTYEVAQLSETTQSTSSYYLQHYYSPYQYTVHTSEHTTSTMMGTQ
jgi:hypothetical protein